MWRRFPTYRDRLTAGLIVLVAAIAACSLVESSAGQLNRNARELGARGRDAERPTRIPWSGWQDIFFRVYAGVTSDRLLANAAGVAFYALLAIFPAIAALVSIYGLFLDPSAIGGNLAVLKGVVPREGIAIIAAQLERLASAGQSGLGLTFAISLVVSLWSANAGTKALFDALNVTCGEVEKRNFFRLTAVAMAFTAGMVVVIVAALGLTVVLPAALDIIGFNPGAFRLVSLMSWPALLFFMAMAIALLYRFGPSRSAAKFRWLTIGSVFATAAWLTVSALYSWYAANLASFSQTYGSLGAVIGLMMWLWLSTFVVLLGAELNAEIEHQTAKDSTVGPDRSIGQRGAYMADTLGALRGTED